MGCKNYLRALNSYSVVIPKLKLYHKKLLYLTKKILKKGIY